MSRDGSIDLDFGGETRAFRLGIGEWEKVQEATGAGPFELYGRLGAGVRATVAGLTSVEGVMLASATKLGAQDVRWLIYHALIGGGATPAQATRLVRENVLDRPVAEPLALAFEVAAAGVVGHKDEPPGEREGEGESAQKGQPSPTDASASPTSTEPAPR